LLPVQFSCTIEPPPISLRKPVPIISLLLHFPTFVKKGPGSVLLAIRIAPFRALFTRGIIFGPRPVHRASLTYTTTTDQCIIPIDRGVRRSAVLIEPSEQSFLLSIL